MEKSWIVYGPQDTRKTLLAPDIAKALKLTHVVEDWDGQEATYCPLNTLHIMHSQTPPACESRRVLSIEQARQLVAEKS